jgi:hypothetical protein
MAKRTVEESSLTMVADAIREGSGTTGDMEFPGEFQERAKSMANAVKFTEQTLTEEQKAQARENIGLAVVEPAEDDIPKVFFGGALPQTKTDMVMSFRYISKTEDISGYCKTKAQGNSSMSYPKKNQTVKLYKDAECTEKLKVDFKGWGKQNKFCFKANWVDLTHARNIVSARLWGDVVKSRSNYAEIPELLRTSPNQGAVDGFPVKVYANGVYQGRYTINIPKDAWMANMDDELDTHCILCGENYVSGCFRAEATIDGNDWTDEVHDTVPNAIETRWNEAIRFVMNSTDDEFVAGIGNYFDIPSLIDYYCFGLVTCNMDGFGKNQLYHTYDGLKWFATVYDMDSTFGTYFSRILPYDFARTSYEDFNTSYPGRCGNLLYIRLENLFADEIKSRYIELRDGALSVDNIINRFERFTDITPNELIIEDYAETTGNGAFAGIPLQGESTIQQIRNYTVKRLEYVDTCILQLDYGLIYALPAETSFNGTSDYIDTGINLLDTHKDFAVFVDFAGAATQVNTTDYWKRIVQMRRTWNDRDVHPGFEIRMDGNYQLSMRTGSDAGQTIYDIPDIANNTTDRQRYIFQKDISAGTVTFYYVDASGNVQIGRQHELLDGDATYSTPHDTLTLGAYQETNGTGEVKSGYWTGTFHDCKVWNRPLTESEINTLLINGSEGWII